MIKVKEYLDKYFYRDGEVECILKKNGHYSITGCWQYPHNMEFPPQEIRLYINNETIRINILGIEKESLYSYLQTYEHIPRGYPDINGYYARSTDEEVINYIDSFYQILAKDIIRDEKIDKFLL